MKKVWFIISAVLFGLVILIVSFYLFDPLNERQEWKDTAHILISMSKYDIDSERANVEFTFKNLTDQKVAIDSVGTPEQSCFGVSLTYCGKMYSAEDIIKNNTERFVLVLLPHETKKLDYTFALTLYIDKGDGQLVNYAGCETNKPNAFYISLPRIIVGDKKIQ